MGQKSELQLGRPPESEPNHPEKGPEWGLGASTENPLKAFLNPPNSETKKTGRPGDRTMEMNGGSAASYLARTLCIAVLLLILRGLEAKGLLDFQARRGITSVVWWNPRPVTFGVD